MSNWTKTLRWAAILLGFTAVTSLAQIGPPPVITVQPLGLSVPKKGTAVMTVVAVSATTLSYQWYKDGEKLSGATAPVLTIAKVSNGDAGSYQVVVQNASGVVRSAAAALIVLAKEKTALPIKAAKMKPEGFELAMEGLTVSQCVIYASTDMVNWHPIATNSVSAGTANFTDTAASSRPGCFYKVMDE